VNSPPTKFDLQKFWQPALIAAALAFLYAPVLPKLFAAWQTDENYSHGLLIPVLIGYLLWLEKPELEKLEKRPAFFLGGALVILALGLLFTGTLGAEVFTQRVSFVVMLAGIAIYFFGAAILRFLTVPLVLLALAIPVPAILLNQITFPLQLLATDLAVPAIRAFGVPAAKFGNVIELLPRGASQSVFLEVVEACSGIRSLMTLVSLALVYAYFTSRNRNFFAARNFDLWRAVALMLAALPIAVLTNAARVAATGLIAFYYGREIADGFMHDVSGWLVYVAALALLLTVGFAIDKMKKLTANGR
jgi:exosortase